LCGDACSKIPDWDIGAPLNCVMSCLPQSGARIFLEEDVIPVAPWSPSDYTDRWAMMESDPGVLWPSITIAMQDGRTVGDSSSMIPIPQRFVRDGGCPEWLPPELCEPALAANAKVVGRHFLHLDKMSRGAPEMEQKNALLAMLIEMLGSQDRPHQFGSAACEKENADGATGLGDMVAAGLSAVGITKERVSKMLGKPCGCAKRQKMLNELGRRLGIG
jgi:hypothetical protein